MADPTDAPSTDGAPDPEEAPKLRPDQFQLHWQSNGTFLGWALGRVRPDNTMSVTHTTFGERPDYFPQALIDALNAALELNGHCVVPLSSRVVPEDRPAQCPNCGSTDPRKVGIRPASPLTGDGAYSVAFSEVCSDPWHDEPAGVPALDDDTRRERRDTEGDDIALDAEEWAEALKSNVRNHVTVTNVTDTAELARLLDRVAAYLGGTDAR